MNFSNAELRQCLEFYYGAIEAVRLGTVTPDLIARLRAAGVPDYEVNALERYGTASAKEYLREFLRRAASDCPMDLVLLLSDCIADYREQGLQAADN